MRKAFSLTMVVAIVGLSITVSANAGEKSYLTTVGEGADQIPLVVVKGSPYEMGRQQGELIKEQAQEFSTVALQRIQAGDPERFTNKALDEAWNQVAQHTDPRFLEELKGLAEGTEISLKKLQRLHAIPFIADYSCSSISAWGEATKDGHLYQTRNLDWEMGLRAQEFPLIVVYIPEEGIPHVNITFAGCIGANTGMNAAGIVLSEMGDSPGSDYPFDLNGVHFTTLFRHVLYDADGLDQAIDIFKNAKRTKKYHYVVGDGKNGRAVKMLAHAPDLIIWSDNDASDEKAPNIFKNIVYQDEGRGAYQPLKKAYGKIDGKQMIDLTCKIPIKGANVLDVVYDATALEFWVAYAEKDEEAYQRPFVHVKLKDYLK